MNKTKRAIFQSAVKIFSGNGYNGSTMDDIAINAGVAKGTLYYHFKSKEEIFKYIITEGMALIKEEMEEAVSKEDSLIDKLKTLCKVQLNLVYENKDFFKMILSQLWGDESRHLELRDVIQRYLKYVQGYIQQGIDAGLIKEGNSYLMAYSFFGTICSAAVYELMNQEGDKVDDTIEHIIHYLLKGIEK